MSVSIVEAVFEWGFAAFLTIGVLWLVLQSLYRHYLAGTLGESFKDASVTVSGIGLGVIIGIIIAYGGICTIIPGSLILFLVVERLKSTPSRWREYLEVALSVALFVLILVVGFWTIYVIGHAAYNELPKSIKQDIQHWQERDSEDE